MPGIGRGPAVHSLARAVAQRGGGAIQRRVDKSFFRIERFSDLDHLRVENASFIAFHNVQHRYAAHGGASPAEIWRSRPRFLLESDYRAPTRLPAKGWIEAIRYVRSNGLVDLWGKRITLEEEHRHVSDPPIQGRGKWPTSRESPGRSRS